MSHLVCARALPAIVAKRTAAMAFGALIWGLLGVCQNDDAMNRAPVLFAAVRRDRREAGARALRCGAARVRSGIRAPQPEAPLHHAMAAVGAMDQSRREFARSGGQAAHSHL